MSLRELIHDGLLKIIAFEELEEVIHRLRREHRRRRPICHGRFEGMYHRNIEGELIVGTQQLNVGEASTAPLVFTDANGVTGPGPLGIISSSDGSVSVGLSADGQSANVLMTSANVTSTLTWHDPAGAVPDFSVDVSDVVAPPVFVPVAGDFGTFVPGTTL